MKKVLFVDDDQGIINGLKRIMRSLRNEWDMHFVLDGQSALALLEKDRFDVIVSDMRMPGINGAELLSRVREKYPHMVRIILSGYSDQDLLLKAVRPAHQFLSKPCDAETLKKTVLRITEIQNILNSTELKEIVSNIDSLPSLPSLYQEITQALQKEDVAVKEIGEIIQKDIGMSAQILKLVNSSFFGFFKNISNPVQATSLLGIDTVKTLVLSIGIFSSLKYDQELLLSYDTLWNHSTLTATFAKHIAGLISKDQLFIEDAFIAGFLHDIGILILASKLPDRYEKILNKVSEDKRNIWEVEKELLGTNHAEIGAYLLGLWRFSNQVVEAVIRHHNPEIFGDEPNSLVTVLHLADSFAHHLDPAVQNLSISKLDAQYLKNINIYEEAQGWFSECKRLIEKAPPGNM